MNIDTAPAPISGSPRQHEMPRLPVGSRSTLASLSLFMLLPSLGTSITNVSLLTLQQAFDASFQQVQWVVISFLLVTTTLVVSAGRLGDLVGRRRLMMLGIGIFTAASAVGALAPALWVLVAARALQGIGACAMLALTIAFVGQTVPRERTGSAMGLLGTMSAVGTALGPSLGGLLIAAYGWPSMFVINVPLGLLALWCGWRYLPHDAIRASEPARFDHAGTAVLAASLAAYALAMTFGRGRFGVGNAALLCTALIGLAAFIQVERRAASPLIMLSLFRNGRLAASLAMSTLVSTVLMATLVVSPFYLARSLGLGTVMVGLVLSAGPVVAALTGVPAGRLVDHHGSGKTSIVGLCLLAGGCAALAAVPAHWGIVGFLLPSVVVTSGYALFQAANNASVMADVPGDRRGVVSGLLTLSRNLGLITGASAMAAVFAAVAGSANPGSLSADAVGLGMHATFALATLLMAACVACAWWSQARSATTVQEAHG